MDATIKVKNATNLMSTAEVRGDKGVDTEGMVVHGIRFHGIQQRSLAFICTQNVNKQMSQQKRLIEYGKRLPGDFVVHFQKEHSTNGKIEFNFHDPHIKFNHILVAVNVCIIREQICEILSIQFAISFQSPWAMVFKNKIITADDRFHATIYDLKRNNFEARLIIYGVKY